MNYILFQDDPDPAMRYEGLARFAFNCESWGGPNGAAHQSFYNKLFVPDTKPEGLELLTEILNALIGKYGDEIDQELNYLKESVGKEMKQKNAIDLIDYVVKILNQGCNIEK